MRTVRVVGAPAPRPVVGEQAEVADGLEVKSLRLAAGALAEAAYLGDTLEPSDSEDEMEAESDLDNGDEENTQ